MADEETRAERVSETFARPFQRVQETRAEILRGEEDLGTFPVLGCVGDRRYAGLPGAPLGDPASDQGESASESGSPMAEPMLTLVAPVRQQGAVCWTT